MSFPTTSPTETSAVRVWGQMVSYAYQLKANVQFYALSGAQGTLDEPTLIELGRRLKPMSDYFAANAGTAGLQAYARVALGDGAFDLAGELSALRSKVLAVYSAGRDAVIFLRTDLAADGTVTEGTRQLTAQQAAPFIAACNALAAQIS